MKLIIDKIFLRKYFGYLYYSILPECTVWDKKSTIIVEPICIFKKKDFDIANCKLIDKILNSSFKVTDIRSSITRGIEYLDWSELEQVLAPLFDNIFELGDNPVLYPGKRMENFITKILPKSPNICQDFDGIIHFHPTGDASLSDKDVNSFRELASVTKKYGKYYIIAVVITRNDLLKYIEKAGHTRNQFITYMMNTLKMTKISAYIFYPKKKEKNISISIS